MTVRQFDDYVTTNKDSDAKLAVHKVTAETAGEVETVTGTVTAKEGQLLVQTSNPSIVEVHEESLLKSYRKWDEDYVEAVEYTDSAPFDPTAHDAKDVRKYLEECSDEEYDRVVAIERANKNRTSAIPVQH